jgi:hypothetical protein
VSVSWAKAAHQRHVIMHAIMQAGPDASSHAISSPESRVDGIAPGPSYDYAESLGSSSGMARAVVVIRRPLVWRTPRHGRRGHCRRHLPREIWVP